MSTPVPAPRHTDTQTTRQTDKKNRQTGTQDTDTQTPTLLTEVVECTKYASADESIYLGRP